MFGPYLPYEELAGRKEIEIVHKQDGWIVHIVKTIALLLEPEFYIHMLRVYQGNRTALAIPEIKELVPE